MRASEKSQEQEEDAAAFFEELEFNFKYGTHCDLECECGCLTCPSTLSLRAKKGKERP